MSNYYNQTFGDAVKEFIAVSWWPIAVVTVAATAIALMFAPPEPPHLLVGYGCEGSNGAPMYYTEESDFPPCSLIESAR